MQPRGLAAASTAGPFRPPAPTACAEPRDRAAHSSRMNRSRIVTIIAVAVALVASAALYLNVTNQEEPVSDQARAFDDALGHVLESFVDKDELTADQLAEGLNNRDKTHTERIDDAEFDALMNELGLSPDEARLRFKGEYIK